MVTYIPSQVCSRLYVAVNKKAGEIIDSNTEHEEQNMEFLLSKCMLKQFSRKTDHKAGKIQHPPPP
jgi:hypothetical protein